MAFVEALELLRASPASAERDQKELDIQLALSRAVIATDGYAAPGAGEIFSQARALCDRLSQPPELVSVLYGQWAHALMRTDLLAAQGIAEELLRLGEARGDSVSMARGCRLNGLTCIARGEFNAARLFLERGLQLHDPKDRGRHAAFTLYDPQIMMRVFLAWSLFDLGYLDHARRHWEVALAEARQSKQPFTLPFALTLSVNAQIAVDDFGAALHGSEELVAHCEEHGVSFFWGIGMIFRGRSLVAHGEVDRGLQQIQDGLVAYRRTHGSLWLPVQLTMIADAYGSIDRPDEGIHRLDEAEKYITAAGQHWSASGMYRVRGELLFSLGDLEGAKVCVLRALDVARGQEARLLQMRASLSLARLASKQGDHAEASRILRPAYEWFTEGLDTPVHQQARALLTTIGR